MWGAWYHAYWEPSSVLSVTWFGYYEYQSPSKSLHPDIVHIDDIDNSRIVEDVYNPSEVINDVDELAKTGIPALAKIHVCEESTSDLQDSLVEFNIYLHVELVVHFLYLGYTWNRERDRAYDNY